MKLTVKVLPKHVLKGTCRSVRKCAVAQAIVDAGAKAVSVDGYNAEFYSTKTPKLYKSVLKTVPLPKRVEKFIQKFDNIIDIPASKRTAARKALAAKLKTTPLNFTIPMTKEESKTLLYSTKGLK